MNDDIELPGFACAIDSADFETGTVTLKMRGHYQVSAGAQRLVCEDDLRAAVLADRAKRASVGPYAWHYWNIGGGSAWHRGPSKHLDADIQAAKEFPRAHHVAPLYLAPPSTPPADALALLLDRLDAFRRERDALVEASRLALDALLGAAFDLIDDTEAQKCDRAINALRAALEGK